MGTRTEWVAFLSVPLSCGVTAKVHVTLQVRYESRRKLAEARPRVKGQFVKAEVAQAHSVATGRSSAAAPAAVQQQMTPVPALSAQPPLAARQSPLLDGTQQVLPPQLH